MSTMHVILKWMARLQWEENLTLLGTREPTHKEVIFCKMYLKLDELC